jgi:Ca-activated chloride channel family protein
MTLSFEYPFIVISSFFIIPLVLLIYSRLKNPFVLTIPLGAPGGVSFKTSHNNIIVRLLKLTEITGIFLLFFSAAGPSKRTSDVVWLNRGADIIFIMDISPSMAALDMGGRNRFDIGRNLIKEFALNRPTDSIGLVAVGDDASILLPPTTDRESLRIRLEQLQIGELGDGTALGMGLAVAAYHLEKSNAKRKVAVLVTDGENNAGAIHPETAANFLSDMGVSFWVIAVGSQGEVPIDYTDPFTNIRRTGIFDSRYDTESLRRLTAAGNGALLFAANSESFNSAFSQLNSNEITIQRSRIINRHHSIFMYFFIPAVLSLILVKFIRRSILGALI